MKTTNRGKLVIVTAPDSGPQVIFEPVNSTVWMRKIELPSLFGVTIQAVHACLDKICREKSIDVERCCIYDLYTSGNRVRYDVREVNLEVIIAMAFRIDSSYARIFRQWFIRRCLHSDSGISNYLPDMEQQAGLN